MPVEKLIVEAYLPKWKDFEEQNIRLNYTLSKVDKLVQLAESKGIGGSIEDKIKRFFKKDIEVNIIPDFTKYAQQGPQHAE